MNKLKMQKLRSGAAAIVSAIILSTSYNASAQNGADILGVDHVGINVPNMSQAVTFFHDVLGFSAVTQIGPIALDVNWKTTNHMQSGTGPVTIKMVRAGTGANIELFEYQDDKGSQTHPGGDDIGASHIAFYTSDIKGGVAYLKSKGVTVLGEPFFMASGDTEGETWVYFLSPWGYKMELVSYPQGKGYEKKHPNTILWSSKNAIELNMTTITPQQLQELGKKQIQIWNERDAQNRLLLMKELYQDEISFFDHDGTSNGIAALNERVTNLQHKNADFKFSLIKVDNSDNAVRCFWNYGPASNPTLVSGMDLFILQDGKVRSLNVFLDRLPPAPKN